METVIMAIVVVIGGLGLGYFLYQTDLNRDAKRWAKVRSNKEGDRKFRVKFRPISKYDKEPFDIITVELLAPSPKAARAGAEIWLDSHVAFEVLEITELKDCQESETVQK